MYLNSFCNSFCKPFDILHFIYIEVFFNGQVDVISSHKTFLNIYMDRKFPFSTELNKMIISSNNKDFLFLWPDEAIEDLPKMLDELCICHGITIVEKTEVSLRTFAFATDQIHNGFANFLINNLDTLKKIKRQFLAEYYTTDCDNKGTFLTTPICVSPKAHSKMQSVKFDNFIRINDQIVSISDKKMAILQLLAEGKSSKEIATILDISARTVDKQIELLMDSTGIHSRKLLIRMYQNDL